MIVKCIFCTTCRNRGGNDGRASVVTSIRRSRNPEKIRNSKHEFRNKFKWPKFTIKNLNRENDKYCLYWYYHWSHISCHFVDPPIISGDKVLWIGFEHLRSHGICILCGEWIGIYIPKKTFAQNTYTGRSRSDFRSLQRLRKYWTRIPEPLAPWILNSSRKTAPITRSGRLLKVFPFSFRLLAT